MNGLDIAKHRVQVNLNAHTYRNLKKLAYETNKSMSGIIRDSIEMFIEGPKSKIDEDKWDEFIKKRIGAIKGKRDDSVSHDKWAGRLASL